MAGMSSHIKAILKYKKNIQINFYKVIEHTNLHIKMLYFERQQFFQL